MAYLAKEKSGDEVVFNTKPVRSDRFEGAWVDPHKVNVGTVLPEGSIECLIGRNLTWEDEPFEFVSVVI